MKRRTKMRVLLSSAAIGVAALIFTQLNMGDSMVYFYTPVEALANAEELSQKTIRVGAMVEQGSVEWEAESLTLRFTLTDFKGAEIKVTHKGTPPDMFKEGAGVVTEGRLSADGLKMASQRLFVKHSEEYQEPGHASSMDHEMLKRSIFKNEDVDSYDDYSEGGYDKS